MTIQTNRKRLRYGLAGAIVMVILAVLTPKVGAKSSAPKYPKKITLYYDEQYAKNYDVIPVGYGSEMRPGVALLENVGYSVECSAEVGKITTSQKAKSSNPKIAKAEIGVVSYDQVCKVYVTVRPTGKNIKNGKTTISFTLKQGGKKYNISTEVTIRKASSPFKSIKINGKDYVKDLNRYHFVDVKAGKKAKVKYKLKSKEYKVEYNSLDYDNYDPYNSQKVKSGKTLKTPGVIVVSKKFPKYYIGIQEWFLYLMK